MAINENERWGFAPSKSLQEYMKELRRPMEKVDPRRYVSTWSEYEVLRKEIVPSFVMVLRTKGCSRYLSGGCTMCGYSKVSYEGHVSSDDIIEQFETALKNFKGEPVVKIYTSGSFFDGSEVPKDVQDLVLKETAHRSSLVLVESLPSFITKGRVEELGSIIGAEDSNLEVAMGLESANGTVRSHSINKSLSLDTFAQAARSLQENGLRTRTYLLLKPPFLTEREAIDDTKRSIEIATTFSDVISINPVNIQDGTLVEQLWHQRLYRPPWLWSLVDVLTTSDISASTMLISKPTGGGKQRGVHNCGSCDSVILQAIEQFSLGAGPALMKGITCECHEEWLDILALDSGLISQG